MRTKRKMALAISAFVMLILAGVVSVVAVLAAKNVTLKSSVTVTFTAGANVMGTATAYYQVGKSGSVVDIFGGTTGAKAEFNGGETGTPEVKKEGLPSVSLDKTNNYITYTFNFTNSSKVANYTAKLKLTGAVCENMIVKTKVGTAAETTVSSSSLSSEFLTVTVPKNNGTTDGSATATLTVTIDDSKNYLEDSKFIGSLDWSLVAVR